MTIAEVAEKYGLSTDTLRYYERIGLIPPVRRGKGSIRDYSDKDIEWVGFIKCMRIANIPIEALIEYVNLFKQGKDTQENRKTLLKEQRDQLA
ncbi:MAG: MerR family transcriptional regulator, partial [Treponema sp.]|nr:MerR family transcriptional regulator [Treponema sp.]